MLHRILLGIIVATLVVTAGCSGVLSGPGTTPDNTSTATAKVVETPTPNESETGSSRMNATDLRKITVPSNSSATYSGELDRADPVRNNTFYEPVAVTVEAGTHVNITMQTGEGEPKLRIRNPNGTVTHRTGDGGQGLAQVIRGTFSQTGRYTIEATSATQNVTFEYNLTITRTENVIFAGPKSTWNETEKYLSFGGDFINSANETANNGQFYNYVHQRTLWANAEKDYLIIGYRGDVQNLTDDEKLDIDVALQDTYEDLIETYRNATDNPKYAEGESWIPEVIYFRVENRQGELYQTNFLTKRWIEEFFETENLSVYAGRYYSTSRIGPGNPDYEVAGGKVTTTQAAFPLETYRNFTHMDGETHGEKYYNANSTDDS